MDDADKSLVSQNGGFVLIYRHFHLPFKQGVRSSNLRWVTKRNTTTCVVVFFCLRALRSRILTVMYMLKA